jgi:hypothetical protein
MALPLHIVRDIQGFMTTGGQTARNFPNIVSRFELTANSVFTITVPTSQGTTLIAYFSFNKAADVFVQGSASPTLAFPAGTADSNVSELNPIARVVTAGQTLQFLTSSSAVYVTISYYEGAFVQG